MAGEACYAIGNDLGTTHSCVAVDREEEVIVNDQGNRTTPSYVASTETEKLVGDSALDQVVNNTTSTGPGKFESFSSQKTELEQEEQKVLFIGKEKEDEDNSSAMILKNPKSNEKLTDEGEVGVESNEMSTDAGDIGVVSNEMSKAFEAIAGVRADVESLSKRVSDLDVAVNYGTKFSDEEFAVSTELLIKQLLKLDSIEVEKDARVQRKAQVRRVQDLLDKLDTLKARNSNPCNNNSNDVTSQNNNGVTSQNNNGVTSQNSNGVASQYGNGVSVTTQSETFDSGMGSSSAPTPMPSSTEVSQDFDMLDVEDCFFSSGGD